VWRVVNLKDLDVIMYCVLFVKRPTTLQHEGVWHINMNMRVIHVVLTEDKLIVSAVSAISSVSNLYFNICHRCMIDIATLCTYITLFFSLFSSTYSSVILVYQHIIPWQERAYIFNTFEMI